MKYYYFIILILLIVLESIYAIAVFSVISQNNSDIKQCTSICGPNKEAHLHYPNNKQTICECLNVTGVILERGKR